MNHATTQTVDAAIAAAGSKITYAGSGVTITGWLLSSEFAVLVGMLLGVAGFVVNWYYRHKLTRAEIRIMVERDKREAAEHRARMGMYE